MKLGVVSSIVLIISATGCKGPQSYSTPNLVGGQEAKSGEYETIVQLDLNDSENRKCSAVKLSDDIAILAAHCIKKGPDSSESDESGISLGTTKSVRYYGYRNVMGLETLKALDATHDLAAIVFPANTFKAPFAELSFQDSVRKRNQLVELVGFGATSFSKDSKVEAKKHWGTNQISNAVGGLITISQSLESVNETVRTDLKKADDNNSIAYKGDSGGPMIVNGKVLGIAVGAFFSTDAKGKTKSLSKENDSKYIHNIYLDLKSPSSRALLSYVKTQEALKENTLTIAGLTEIKIPASSSKFLSPRDLSERNSGDIIAICGGGQGNSGGGQGNSGGGQGGFGSDNNNFGGGAGSGSGNNGNGFGSNNFGSGENNFGSDTATDDASANSNTDADTSSTNSSSFGGPNQDETDETDDSSSTGSGTSVADTLYNNNCQACHAAGTYSKKQWTDLASGSTATPNKMEAVMKSLRSSGDISKIAGASQLD